MSKSTSLALILLSIGLFYTFISPQYAKVQEERALAAEYRNVIDNAALIADQRDALLAKYNSIPKAELDRLSKVLPDNIDTVRLAVDLDSLASRYGIAIKNVRIVTAANNNSNAVVLPGSGGPHEKVTVSFGFIANYANFMSLLSDLERNLRIMDVRSVSFRVTESGLYDFTIIADTYWLKK